MSSSSDGTTSEMVGAILDAIDAMVYVADMETHRILFLNKTGRDIYGDVVGQPCWEALQNQSGPCPFCTNDRLIDTAGRPTKGTNWEFRDNRRNRWCRMNDRAIPWNDGRLVRLAIAIDITGEKERADQLARSHSLLNETQRLAKIGSWELDLITNTLTWTDEIYRMFDVDPTKFGATYEAFLAAIHPDDREKVNVAYTNSLVTKEPYHITHRLLHPDGTITYVREECVTTFDETSGKPLRSLGTVQDVTEQMERQRRLEAALVDAEQARDEKERFLSIMAYDVKQPVATMATYLDLIKERGFLPPGPALDYLPVARGTADKVVSLLDSVIHASALTSADTPIGKLFDAGLTTFSVVSGLALRADAKGITLENQVPRQTLLFGDPIRYEEIVTNLVENSLKFTKRGGTIIVTPAEGTPGGISVVDNGVGIPHAMVGKLFQYGAEVVRGGTDGEPGLGVGLASNREIIERMGGSLTVRSTEGEGSTFTVTLPTVAPSSD